MSHHSDQPRARASAPRIDHEEQSGRRRRRRRLRRGPAQEDASRRAADPAHDPQSRHRRQERISYQIPAFKLGDQYLVYVAAFTHHVGVYPAPKGDAAFNAAVAPYRSGKATLRFKLDEPVPLELITEVVKLRKLDLLEHARKKAAAKR